MTKPSCNIFDHRNRLSSRASDVVCFQKVTKGARHKIVLSIQKLRERQKMLRDFEKVSFVYYVNARDFERVSFVMMKLRFAAFCLQRHLHIQHK